MKQIARLKPIFAAFILLASFSVSLSATLAVVEPKAVLAAGCQENPANGTQADKQAECMNEYINQCRKDFPKLENLCAVLTVKQINKCAKDDNSLKEDCVASVGKDITKCIRQYADKSDSASLSALAKSNCMEPEGPCHVDSGSSGAVIRCTDPSQEIDENQAASSVGNEYDQNDCSGSYSQLDDNNCGILKYLLIITSALSGIAGLVILAMMILGGIQYAMAGPDPSKVQAAKQKIINAVIALVLFAFGFALIQWLVPGGLI